MANNWITYVKLYQSNDPQFWKDKEVRNPINILKIIQQKIKNLKWKIFLLYLLYYFPNVALSDYYLFKSLHYCLEGNSMIMKMLKLYWFNISNISQKVFTYWKE